MTAMLAAMTLGLVLGLRWPVAIWFVGGLVIATAALIAAGTWEMPALLVAYNLGLAAAIVALEFVPTLRLKPQPVRVGRNRSRLD
jgi:cytochrome c biogenesis protein CcdA